MGLGREYWREVVGILGEVIPVYDRVNSWISLGRDAGHRARGVRGRVGPGDAVLDAGSGFGNMSGAAREACAGGRPPRITMCDPLLPMLRRAAVRGGPPAALSCGVFEFMPFRDGRFDAVLCGYSLRDAIDLRGAISELHRVLGEGGRLVIVDLGKPDGALARAGVSAYLRYAVPLLASAAGGRRLGPKFAALHGTFRRWPTNGRLEAMLLERFSSVEFETDLLGGAIMVAARK